MVATAAHRYAAPELELKIKGHMINLGGSYQANKQSLNIMKSMLSLGKISEIEELDIKAGGSVLVFGQIDVGSLKIDSAEYIILESIKRASSSSWIGRRFFGLGEKITTTEYQERLIEVSRLSGKNNLEIRGKKGITSIGTEISGGKVLLESDGDIAAVPVSLYRKEVSEGYQYYEAREWLTQARSGIEADNLLIKSKRNILMQGVKIKTIGDSGLYATGDIVLADAKEYKTYELRQTIEDDGFLGFGSSETTIHESWRREWSLGSEANVGGELTMESGKNQVMVGAKIYAHEMKLRAGTAEYAAVVSLLPGVNTYDYYLMVEESGFGFCGLGLGYYDNTTNKKDKDLERMPTVIRVEDKFLVYSSGGFKQVSSTIEGNVIKIDAREIEVGVAPNLKSRFLHIDRQGFGIGLSLGGGNFGITVGGQWYESNVGMDLAEHQQLSEIIGNFVAIDADQIKDYGARYYAEQIKLHSKIIVHGAVYDTVAYQASVQSGGAGLSIGINSNIGNIIEGGREIIRDDGGLEAIVNKGFAGLEVYSNLMQLMAGEGANFGLNVYARYLSQEKEEWIKQGVATKIKAEKLEEIAKEKLTLEGTQYEVYSAYIKAKYLEATGIKSELKTRLELETYDMRVPLTTKPLPLVGFGIAEGDKNEITYWNARIVAEANLVLEVEGHADMKGVYISAKSLEATFDSLVLASVVDEAEETGFEASVMADFGNWKKSMLGQGSTGNRKHVVGEISAILGQERANVVIKRSLRLVGGMIANAEMDKEGRYTDHGNLQLRVGELFVEHIRLYDDGVSYRGAMQLGLFSKNEIAEIKTQYQSWDQDGNVNATIGLGDIKGGGDLNGATLDVNAAHKMGKKHSIRPININYTKVDLGNLKEKVQQRGGMIEGLKKTGTELFDQGKVMLQQLFGYRTHTLDSEPDFGNEIYDDYDPETEIQEVEGLPWLSEAETQAIVAEIQQYVVLESDQDPSITSKLIEEALVTKISSEPKVVTIDQINAATAEKAALESAQSTVNPLAQSQAEAYSGTAAMAPGLNLELLFSSGGVMVWRKGAKTFLTRIIPGVGAALTLYEIGSKIVESIRSNPGYFADILAHGIDSDGPDAIATLMRKNLQAKIKNKSPQQTASAATGSPMPDPDDQIPKSSGRVNQMNKQIKSGKAPKGIVRVDQPKIAYEKPHVHFGEKDALNIDGTWKHGGNITLTNAQKEWLLNNGWKLPK